MFKNSLLASALHLTAAAAPSPLDSIARDYVRLSLEAETHEAGYVDAYYGPPEWQVAAKAGPRSVADLRRAAHELAAKARAVPDTALSPFERRRRDSLALQLVAAETRLAMIAGERPRFADEAEGLFGVRPELKPLAAYDPVLARVETLVPGEGPLWQRVDAFKDRIVVPADRLPAVMNAAIAECRRRTAANMALPAGERFTLQFVKDKPWSGYNYYKGNATSLIQVNTDLPVRLDRAVDLGCHEGYPGHHVLNALLEQKLARARGWVEFTIYPLYSPESFLAEGSANYGIDLAFPGDEQRDFEARVLYPLAGLDPALAAPQAALAKATRDLAGARLTIARDYLDGHIDRATAVALTQKYGLVSPARAEQSVKFTDTYRSYVINYSLGRDMVAAKVERAGAKRWEMMTALLSEPTLPADLRD